jgi:hypothetical protein
MTDDDLQRLLEEIRAARAALPAEHRELLNLLDVQETAVDDWPDGVINLYATLREPTPTRQELEGVAATWLNSLRTVAFNAAGLTETVRGLDPPTRRLLLHGIAWHEYGHALSVTRATREHRDRGPALLALLPEGLRETIGLRGGHPMAPDPMNPHDVTVFPISQIVPFLRAMADPTGSGDISPQEKAMIEQVESNLARRDEADRRP